MSDEIDKEQEDKGQAVSKEQMEAMERVHIKAGGTFLELMDRSAEQAAAFIKDKFKPCKTLVLCGPGDNGGSAYGTARLLHEAGFEVTVAMDTTDEPRQSPEAQAERNAWHGKIYDFTDVDYSHYKLIVDGLFGTGLHQDLRGSYLKVVKLVNESPAQVVALDIPSGVCSETGDVKVDAVKADYTVTFHRPKYGHYQKEGKKRSGQVILRDVGIVMGDFKEPS
ncbi:MAG: NAD(P)H-hydrate epimerase [Alphaproteobacteria bacterium]|nr:NAD(P)H-hydrate epimerase [Alphaproteobacteria bacterium]NCQ66580.1 NAD(P)H-hydrate epimerase [Alphaproteobacteria bacterium]NCT06932.1 NAD(P)H-hydrate epimerase [Alphaproteobacteria bacterium]